MENNILGHFYNGFLLETTPGGCQYADSVTLSARADRNFMMLKVKSVRQEQGAHGPFIKECDVSIDRKMAGDIVKAIMEYYGQI